MTISTGKKLAIGFGIAATLGTTAVAADYLITTRQVKTEIRELFAAQSSPQRAQHPFYACLADRTAPSVARRRMAEKYQDWKDEYAPALPFDFVDRKPSLDRLIEDLVGGPVLDMSRHIEPCRKAHGTPLEDEINGFLKKLEKKGVKIRLDLPIQ